jgi:pyruvate dehydrogenase E2 component (dihydrolipoamide acetyltransferase)
MLPGQALSAARIARTVAMRTMLYKLVVPNMEGVGEVRVLAWHKGEGELAAEGDLVVELETDKALLEVRAPSRCALRRILFEVGAWSPVGAPLAVLSDTAEEAMGDLLPESLTAIGARFESS